MQQHPPPDQGTHHCLSNREAHVRCEVDVWAADLTDLHPSWLLRTIVEPQGSPQRQKRTKTGIAGGANAQSVPHDGASTSGAIPDFASDGHLTGRPCLQQGEGRARGCGSRLDRRVRAVVGVSLMGLLTVSMGVAILSLAQDEFWQPVWEPNSLRQLHQVCTGPHTMNSLCDCCLLVSTKFVQWPLTSEMIGAASYSWKMSS
jgi:hypothetical protein